MPGLMIGALLSGGRLLTASDSPHKTAKTQAKQLLNETREKERGGDLKGAIDSCLKSLAFVESKDAEEELKKLRKRAAIEAWSRFDRARTEYAAGNYQRAAQFLLAAQELVSRSEAVAFDLALANYRLKHMAEASTWLNVAAQRSAPKDPARISALQSFVIAPGIASPAEKTAAQAWNTDLDKTQLQLRDGAVPRSAACDALFKRQKNENSPPTVFYDLAQCAQFEGDFGAAVRYGEEYLRCSPDAVDLSAAERQMEFWRRLAVLEGPKADDVRRAVGSAILNLQQRRYLTAFQLLKTADNLLPGCSPLKERLAVLAEWRGDFDSAASLWREAVETEGDPEAKARLRDLSDGLPARELQFKQPLGNAKSLLEGLLSHYVIDGEPPSYAYAGERLNEADRDLGAAAVVAPLSPELHLLYLFSVLQRNDMESAAKSIQVLDFANVPVSFYGFVYQRPIQQEKEKDRKPREFVKIELDNRLFQMTDVSFCNLKKHKSSLPLSSLLAGSDRLAGFGAVRALAGTSSGMSVAREQIKKIETKNEFVYLQVDNPAVKHKKLFIEPVQLATDVPLKGPGARRYANQYTTLLSQRLDFDKAKLGKESMTVGEKFEMAQKFIAVAFDVYGAVGNPLGAYTAIKDARLLTQYMMAMRAHAKTGTVAQLGTSLDTSLRPIPTEALDLTFREPDGTDALAASH